MKQITLTLIAVVTLSQVFGQQYKYEDIVERIDVERTINTYMKSWIHNDIFQLSDVIHPSFEAMIKSPETKASMVATDLSNWIQSPPSTASKWYIDYIQVEDNSANARIIVNSRNSKKVQLIWLIRDQNRWFVASYSTNTE